MHARRSQGGWGLLVVLVALAVVAFLARDALTAWLGGATRAAGTGNAAAPAPAAQGDAEAAAAAALPRPADRARGVEDTVARAAEARAKALEERGR